ncbi:hypothetical protein [Mycobacterium intracellulare]|uniref:hypothetical protein n=1 Tax=Mycobacterium intracellulare TaxID=1767 RepID=UPI000BAC1F65|nr:hypothetical protein [Mycobacterium intracellulare]ASX03563.1 hypothetical protein CKJ58_26450 [Mycobacterium intracellulare subsp. chimaera]PBA61346.1 hypothetical protein CKJ56_13420 [Mycobacterium intracellulare subsp. chimaera]
MSELVACWLYTRPRTRRLWFILQAIWGSALAAVATAPVATADTLGAAWSFTGLHDSYGVPIGQHFVSLPPLMEMVGANGPEFGANPMSWAPAIMSSLDVSITYAQLNLLLAWETAFLIGVCAIGIWLIKFALGVLWLTWLGAIAEPLVETMKAMIQRMHLLEGGILVSIVAGGLVCLTTGFGSGIGIIVGGVIALVLFWVFLRDPAGDLVSDHGILGVGRSLGFALAQGVYHNGPIADGGTNAQLDTLTSWMVDVLVRDLVELVNFGQLIDDIPGCSGLYNAALLRGADAAQAIRACAPDGYTHALHLDASTAGLFFIGNCCVLVILFALDYMGVEAFRVGFKAFWNVFIVVPAAVAAVFPGPARQFAKKAAARVLLHGAEMMAATVGLGILVLILSGVTRGTLPGTIGMTAPLAKILVMMLLAVVGALAFRFALLRAFGDHGIPGPVQVLRGGYRLAHRTARTARDIDSGARVIHGVGSRLKDLKKRRANQAQGQGQGENGGPGLKPPGRKAHPPTSGPGRTGGGPHSGSATGPAPSRPGGGGPGSGGAPVSKPSSPTPAAHKSPATVGGSAGRAAAARTAAEVTAPEVALPAAAGASLAHHAVVGVSRKHRDTRGAQAPGRSGSAAAPQRKQQAPTQGDGSGPAQKPADAATRHLPGEQPPRRTTPNP